MRSQEMTQHRHACSRHSGIGNRVGNGDAQLTRKHEKYVLHEQVVGRTRRPMRRPARRWPSFLNPHDLDCFAASSGAL
ncbi:hypothetical protein LMG29542_06916 [Paraburkholderia humisilvae]|uniref:Uncharacterized protein n=1 Tax=Paraburkholderia humisilvae TaxID=627669 RepID=A0A6J5F175_9BURK|nr:hypothetical protein LMG29542_06916 [Paraburkholderia humisilvae]